MNTTRKLNGQRWENTELKGQRKVQCANEESEGEYGRGHTCRQGLKYLWPYTNEAEWF